MFTETISINWHFFHQWISENGSLIVIIAIFHWNHQHKLAFFPFWWIYMSICPDWIGLLVQKVKPFFTETISINWWFNHSQSIQWMDLNGTWWRLCFTFCTRGSWPNSCSWTSRSSRCTVETRRVEGSQKKISWWYGIIIIIWDIIMRYYEISNNIPNKKSVYSNQSTILRIWWYDMIYDMIYDIWYMMYDIWYGIWDMIKHISPWRIWDVQRTSLREYLQETMDENIRGSCPFSLKPILGDVEREWNGCYWNIQLGKWW